MWSYLRQNHPRKAEELAGRVINEARQAYDQCDDVWNSQLKLTLSNVLSHMKVGLESFSPFSDVHPKTCSFHFLALLQDWILARKSRSSPPRPHEDIAVSLHIQSKQALASMAVRASPPRVPHVRGSSSAVASAAAAAIGVDPFPLILLMRTLRRRDADWPPEVCGEGKRAHSQHVTRHTSHVTRHLSHVTCHTSLVIRHLSHVTS